MNDTYQSPLTQRYASDDMIKLFSPFTRAKTWRLLWVALAKAQNLTGLNVSAERVAELAAHTDDIDFECVEKRERQVRHDVMAHVYAYGIAAPKAAGIIHLGATSCYVTDNADILIYRDALRIVRERLLGVMKALADFADRYKDMPCLGYTHYQPAQPVTVGKRASLWLQDFATDLEDLDYLLGSLKLLGCRGTTGTEASFMELYEGAEDKIDEMNSIIASEFGFDKKYDVCGQTYPRKLDSRIAAVLSGIAQSAYKMADDIRLLQHDRQIEEPFEKDQIGSSAMPYKRNPMRCERICSLSRYIINDYGNTADTAATQWLERTLDDSANRRISLPEGFMATDAVLILCANIAGGLVVNEKIVAKTLNDYLPFIATENLLMEGVKRGGNRQELHELIRTASMKATAAMKNGESWDLLADLAKDGSFGMSEAEMRNVLDPKLYTGRCASQVSAYLKKLEPVLAQAKEAECTVKY